MPPLIYRSGDYGYDMLQTGDLTFVKGLLTMSEQKQRVNFQDFSLHLKEEGRNLIDLKSTSFEKST